MARNHVSFYLRVLTPAIILYSIFFAVRILGFQPPAEAEMGDFLTALFFIFGASITFFTFIYFYFQRPAQNPNPSPMIWLFTSYFLLLLAFDEIYMIHENIGWALKIPDTLVFVVYGFILMAIIYLFKSQLTTTFMFLLGGFIVLAGISVVSDTLFGEGYIGLFGFNCDFEQLAESLGALSLSSAFVSAAIREIRSISLGFHEAPDQSVPEYHNSINN